MSGAETNSERKKAVILAAGEGAEAGSAEPMVLQELDGRWVIDYVVANALQVVAPADLYIVVGRSREALEAHLGLGCSYVFQEEQRGTGHAVLQAYPLLRGFRGDLLILYGDTPLLQPGTVRGLLNRHHLRQAHLTLLTAVVQRPLPYGRVVRDPAGQIVDIVEEVDATPQMREIRELNAGAYVVRAEVIFPALEQACRPGAEGLSRLTDCVHHLIHSGLRVESYQIYDQDEVQGINSTADLAQAEFILQKRLYRPRRQEEQETVTFGTGGWRAIIGEGFTMPNVRRLAQALANDVTRQGEERRGVTVGYDRRFLSDRAAETAAEVFAGNNIPVTLLAEDAPTPLITYATVRLGSYYGLAFTASHNPPEWNGLKVFCRQGALLPDDDARRIEDETNALTSNDIVRIDLDLALESGIVRRQDLTNEYVDAVEALIDLEAIRDAGLKLLVDPMHGVGQLTLGIILTEARCRVAFIHERRNPLFGGRSPAPNTEALQLLIAYVREGGYDLGLATDGDADRIAIVDETGEYITVNDTLVLLYWYLHEVRGERGGVVRNLATTHLLDRLAAHFGEKHREVPVGFKHIVAGMVADNALLGGESSGGLTVRGHILGKDGIFAAALIVEMLARTGMRISQLREKVYGIVGRLYAAEAEVPATPEMRIILPRRLQESTPSSLGPYRLLRLSHEDGTKLYLENDNWALLRFSGTEPVLRLHTEADSPQKAQELIEWLRKAVER